MLHADHILTTRIIGTAEVLREAGDETTALRFEMAFWLKDERQIAADWVSLMTTVDMWDAGRFWCWDMWFEDGEGRS